MIFQNIHRSLMIAVGVPVWDVLICYRNGTPGWDLEMHRHDACLSLPVEKPKEVLLSYKAEKYASCLIK